MAKAVKARATAPGQYLGYGLQSVRLCFHLLNGDPDGTASIEHLDDVALKNSDNTVLLEQTKSALRQNPISDWSEDLWKTLANWIHNIRSGIVDPTSTRFQLYVTPVRSGYWANRLSDTNFSDDVAGLISDLERKVMKRKTLPRSYQYIREILGAGQTTITHLVVNFMLKSDEDPIEPIRSIFRPTVPEALLDSCCDYAIGSAKDSADQLIRSGQPAIVNISQFQKEVRAFIAKHNLVAMLPSFASRPTQELIHQTLDDRPMFVRQLNIVDMPNNLILRAISNYLQSVSDKTDWSEKGLVVNDSLLEFDETLVQRYEMERLELDELHGDLDPTGQGRLLYRRCVSTTSSLEGRDVPFHFVPGSYNCLADRLVLGWHPSFASLLDPEVH